MKFSCHGRRAARHLAGKGYPDLPRLKVPGPALSDSKKMLWNESCSYIVPLSQKNLVMKLFSPFFAIVTGCLLVCTAVSAQHKAGYVSRPQHKIGFVNMDELIAAMPETRHVRQSLQASADSLSRIDANLQQEFTRNRDAFFRDSATMDSTKKEAQRRILQKLLQQYNQFRADAKVQLDSTQQAMAAAVEAIAERLVTATAKANGYSYVFRQLTGSGDQRSLFILVAPEADDLLPLIKKQLIPGGR